jgi:hypothetical protein
MSPPIAPGRVARLWRRAAAGVALVLVLASVFVAYLDPDLSNRLWSCFG